MSQKILFCLIVNLLPICMQAQEDEIFCTGLTDDLEAIRQMPMKKEVVTRGYLPTSVSLQEYCPRAGSQSFHGQAAYATCTAWATVYAAMTITEAIRWGWKDRDVITAEAFSPLFVYAKTKFAGDNDCNWGIGLYTTLPFLKETGAAKHRNYSNPCADNVPRWVTDEASDHKITAYGRLFEEPYPGNDRSKIEETKKAIAAKKPVIIGMWTPRSFQKAGEVWQGELAAGEQLSKNPDHCMCVVGYDDNKADGAFLVMNSWGEQWGKDGFTWVRYDDYVRFVGYAFEISGDNGKQPVTMQPKPQQQIQPQQQQQRQQEENVPAVINDEAAEETLAGSLTVKLKNGEMLDVHRTKREPYPMYRVEGKFLEGIRFQLFLTNENPVYAYVISNDLENNVNAFFPYNASVSPALTYTHSEIAIPNEKVYAEIGTKSSRNFLYVLYSTCELPMGRIMDYIRQDDGDIEYRLSRAIDTLCPGQCAKSDAIRSERDRIAFTATTSASIVPLIIEIRKK